MSFPPFAAIGKTAAFAATCATTCSLASAFQHRSAIDNSAHRSLHNRLNSDTAISVVDSDGKTDGKTDAINNVNNIDERQPLKVETSSLTIPGSGGTVRRIPDVEWLKQQLFGDSEGDVEMSDSGNDSDKENDSDAETQMSGGEIERSASADKDVRETSASHKARYLNLPHLPRPFSWFLSLRKINRFSDEKLREKLLEKTFGSEVEKTVKFWNPNASPGGGMEDLWSEVI
jgi:hypothetical protein